MRQQSALSGVCGDECPWWNWIPLEPPTLPVRVRAPADTPRKKPPCGAFYVVFSSRVRTRGSRERSDAQPRGPLQGYRLSPGGHTTQKAPLRGFLRCLFVEGENPRTEGSDYSSFDFLRFIMTVAVIAAAATTATPTAIGTAILTAFLSPCFLGASSPFSLP